MSAQVTFMDLGYIGLPTAALIASKGIPVQGVDVNKKVVDTINKGKIHIVEPDLEGLVHYAVQKGLLVASTSVKSSDVFLVAVPTPFKGDHEPDLAYVEKFETLPDIDALRLFFSRVESDQSKTDRLESLKHLYETGEINQPDQLILRYFLSKLKAVVDRTKQLEANVEKFVEQVTVYLSLSSDEKTLTYDSNLMKVVVRNVFNGEEIDLEALSSGEKQVISLFSHLYLESGQKIVLIDEPELSLSLDWQKRLLPDVITSPGCAQLLAITHSPFIFDNDLDRYAGPMQIRRQGEASRK